MTETEQSLSLWPDDADNCPGSPGEPNTELAVILLAAGCSQSYIRRQCHFETQRDVQAFCRDEDTRQRAAELSTERAKRVGKRALVCLEQILNTPQTDLRAQVLAVRTALEVSGDLKRDHSAPVKTVRELTVPELSELIDATKKELDARVTRYRAGVRVDSSKSAA